MEVLQVFWGCEGGVELYCSTEFREEHCNNLVEERSRFWVRGEFLTFIESGGGDSVIGGGKIQFGRSGGLRVAIRRGFNGEEQREQGGSMVVLCEDTINRGPYINLN